MLFTTTTQWAALVVALIAGWLLGLASHPGGKRWKTRYAAERDANQAARRDHDARLQELERENTELRRTAPVTAQAVAPQSAARPADRI